MGGHAGIFKTYSRLSANYTATRTGGQRVGRSKPKPRATEDISENKEETLLVGRL